MTKQHELQILTETAEKLGADSYCGPWLKSQIPFIENDMRNDFNPTAVWEDKKKELSELNREIEAAKMEKKRILEETGREVAKLRQEACDYDSRVREELCAVLRKCERELNR